jgi:N6-L-threonylcarbamoyladenine synthase
MCFIMRDTIILGIETSCDDTSAAIVKDGRYILSNIISSQARLHEEYGGVVPEIASRRHVELIIPAIDRSIKDAGISVDRIDAIGVTYGPGLVGALLVGLSCAKALAFSWEKPFIGVHHIEGHIAANYLEYEKLTPPFLCLVVSGGHTHLVHVKDYEVFEILGRTRDDAAGEAFDKTARVLGLGYPGGPAIDRCAQSGDGNAISFPRTVFSDGSFDFSFSGLKTAVMNFVNSMKQKSLAYSVEDICASFQEACVDVLVRNTINAAEKVGIEKIAIAGGVAANSLLRKRMLSCTGENNLEIYYPRPVLCTDNAAMIACAAYYRYIKGEKSDFELNAIPNMKLC